MLSGDAAALLRQWFTAHLTTVGRALAWYGVSQREDRADLTQDVFFSAYLALLRGEQIDNPRAWLRECARKHASNQRRKELRRKPLTGAEAASSGLDPERIAAERELLRRAFECLDEDGQSIVFDVRVDGLRWEDIAQERRITVDQARYLYQRAVSQMEEALNRDDSNEKERRSIGPPIALTLLFDAARAEADDVSPDTRRRIWERLEQRMNAAGAGASDASPDPDRERERERPDSLRASPGARPIGSILPPRIQLGAMLGLVGGGIAIGVVIGYLLRGPLPARSPPAPGAAGQASIVAAGPPPNEPREVDGPALLLTFPAPTTPPEASGPSVRPRGKGAFVTTTSRAASGPSTIALLDRARAAIASGDAPASLALLAQHARRSPAGQDARARRELLQLVCGTIAARAAPECADASQN